jgi:hypothetical protein
VVFGEFALFAHVYEQKFIAAVDSRFHRIDIRLADASAGIVNDFQKAGRVLVSHGFSLIEI